jgi:putative MATE family efflux protein
LQNIKEYKKIWAISAPIMLSLLAQNIVSITDTAFLGRVGEIELGASALAGLYYFCFYMIGFGFGSGLQIVVSRRKGERNDTAIGTVIDNGIYFLFFLAVLLIIVSLLFAPIFFRFSISSEAILNQSIVFLNYRIWGLFFAFGNIVFRSFFVGIANTRYLTYNAIIMAGLNILLDYVLIFGKFGFPEMGLKGAAIASVISEAAAAIFFVIIVLRNKKLRIYNLFRFLKPQIQLINSVLGVSFYIMLQFFISLGGWFVFFLIIEKTGERSLAISNVIRSIYMLLMIPVWGYCSAVSTLVSSRIGEGKTNEVIPVIKRVTLMSFATTSILIGLVSMFPSFSLSVYTNDIHFINDGIASLYVVLGATVVFSLTMISFNAISGTANTNISLYIEIITIIVYLAAAWFLAQYYARPEIIWCSEYVYYILTGAFSIVYLWKGNWRNKRI